MALAIGASLGVGSFRARTDDKQAATAAAVDLFADGSSDSDSNDGVGDDEE